MDIYKGIGLLVAAAGFTGINVALLRMTNDEFDLPATSIANAREEARSDATAALN